MVYSSGSLFPDPSDAFTYLTAKFGLFDDCRDVKATNEDTPYDAQYCILAVYIPGVSKLLCQQIIEGMGYKYREIYKI